MARKKE